MVAASPARREASTSRSRASSASLLHLRLLGNKRSDGPIFRHEIQTCHALNVPRRDGLNGFVRLEQLRVVALEHLVGPEQIRATLDGFLLAVKAGEDLVLRLAQFGGG